MALGRQVLNQILGDQLQVIAFRNIQRWAIEKSKHLSQLTKYQSEKMLDSMKICNFKIGDIVLKKGTEEKIKKIFIMIEGVIKGAKNGKQYATKYELWGEDFLFLENANKKLEDDLIATSDAIIAEIDYEKFKNVVGGTIEELLKKNENSYEKKMMQYSSNVKKNGSSLLLKDLIHIKKLGAGQFGSVYLVRSQAISNLFALKCVSKKQVMEQNLEKYLQAVLWFRGGGVQEPPDELLSGASWYSWSGSFLISWFLLIIRSL